MKCEYEQPKQMPTVLHDEARELSGERWVNDSLQRGFEGLLVLDSQGELHIEGVRSADGLRQSYYLDGVIIDIEVEPTEAVPYVLTEHPWKHKLVFRGMRGRSSQEGYYPTHGKNSRGLGRGEQMSHSMKMEGGKARQMRRAFLKRISRETKL